MTCVLAWMEWCVQFILMVCLFFAQYNVFDPDLRNRSGHLRWRKGRLRKEVFKLVKLVTVVDGTLSIRIGSMKYVVHSDFEVRRARM